MKRRRRGERLALRPIFPLGSESTEMVGLPIQIMQTPALHRGSDSITVTLDPHVVEILNRIATALEGRT